MKFANYSCRICATFDISQKSCYIIFKIFAFSIYRTHKIPSGNHNLILWIMHYLNKISTDYIENIPKDAGLFCLTNSHIHKNTLNFSSLVCFQCFYLFKMFYMYILFVEFISPMPPASLFLSLIICSFRSHFTFPFIWYMYTYIIHMWLLYVYIKCSNYKWKKKYDYV